MCYAEVLQSELAARGSSPAAGLIHTVEAGVVTKRSSRIAGMSRKELEGEPLRSKFSYLVHGMPCLLAVHWFLNLVRHNSLSLGDRTIMTTTVHVGVVMPASTRVPLESPASSEMNEEDESPEADLDYLDEYDSEEERRQRRKKKVGSKLRH